MIDRSILVLATLLAVILLHFGFDGATSETGAGYVHIVSLIACGAVATLILLAIFKKA